jgi:hypothetical protein
MQITSPGDAFFSTKNGGLHVPEQCLGLEQALGGTLGYTKVSL